MEALYSKLYEKYTRLKAKQASDIEQLNFDQEEKFKNYVSAADDLIGYLTSEKERLTVQITDLRQEVASIRSAKVEEQEKYETMLIENNRKNKELSEKIEKLQRELSGSLPSPGTINNSTIRKKRRDSTQEKDVEVNIFSAAFNQSKCCRRRLDSSENVSDSSICMFQELMECLLDLKLSIATHDDDNILIAAVHESSGYSFNLGWVKNKAGEEELLYRVESLGTFERVAPEWMRDVMLFSKSMCRNFFKRISAIVKPHD